MHDAVCVDGKFAPERIGAMSVKIDADIFVLQEVALRGPVAPGGLAILRLMTSLRAVAGAKSIPRAFFQSARPPCHSGTATRAA